MKVIRSIQRYPLAITLTAAILAGWGLAAFLLDQSIFAVQRSRLLLGVGAANGQILHDNEWWRILTSQFLHVYFPRMLANAVGVFVVAGPIEGRYGSWRLALIYFLGGSTGQVASVVYYPDLVSSGASQALMALCAAALLLKVPHWSKLVAIAIVVAQIALDIYVAGTIKAGHSFGFGGGLLIAGAFILLTRPRKERQHANGL